MREKSTRIFELDALRGVCILCMIAVHIAYDYDLFIGFEEAPIWFTFFQDWGGLWFLALSGVCVTLGHHPIRRGLIVFGCGLVCSVVTYFAGDPILFGILHCLGICMMLSPLLLKLPKWCLVAAGIPMIAAGMYIHAVRFSFDWLFFLGLRSESFASADYFPLLPNLGWFMLGIFLGKILYKNKTTLLPKVNPRWFPLPVLCWVGKYSLWIYLGHQPIIYGLFYLCTQ